MNPNQLLEIYFLFTIIAFAAILLILSLVYSRNTQLYKKQIAEKSIKIIHLENSVKNKELQVSRLSVLHNKERMQDAEHFLGVISNFESEMKEMFEKHKATMEAMQAKYDETVKMLHE